MDAGQLVGLRQVDREELTQNYRGLTIAVLHAKSNTNDIDRWPNAARAMCQFLNFIQREEALWLGLNEAVAAAEGSQGDLEVAWSHLNEFTDAEFELLVRSGVDKDTAGRIICDIRGQLQQNVNLTQNDIDEMRENVETIQGYLCNRDFTIYSRPEREARNLVNSNAMLAGGGGLVAAVTNAIGVLIPPFVAGSVVGGIAAAAGGFRGFQRRRRG